MRCLKYLRGRKGYSPAVNFHESIAGEIPQFTIRLLFRFDLNQSNGSEPNVLCKDDFKCIFGDLTELESGIVPWKHYLRETVGICNDNGPSLYTPSNKTIACIVV